jgi:predicted RNA-binding Zn ribbon-like protein
MLVDRVEEDFLLELLNTSPTDAGVRRDLLFDAAGARAWLRAHDAEATDEEVTAVRRARDAIQRMVRGGVPDGDFAELLDGVVSEPRVSADGLTWSVRVPPGRRAAVRLIQAWARVQEQHPGRLRACENPECTRFLLDRSRPNTGQWCSMALCGNRMKARRHYQKLKTDGD